MPEYRRGEHVLTEAHLRQEGLGDGLGVLVVEGPDDRRALARHVHRPQQLLPAMTRRLVLDAHAAKSVRPVHGVLFLIDCDYAVPEHQLRAGNDLVITKNTDLESDLVEIGLISDVVAQLHPRALDGEAALSRAVTDVVTRAVAIAEPLGRIRRLAFSEGFPVETSGLKHRRLCTSGLPDEERIAEVVAQRSPGCPYSPQELHARISGLPAGYVNCNGHDLCEALAWSIVEAGGDKVLGADVERMLRLSLDRERLSQLDAHERIRRWERSTGFRILR